MPASTFFQLRTAESASKAHPSPLQGGKAYYIEALNKEGGGGDNVTVAVRLPGAGPFTNGQPSIPLSMFKAARPTAVRRRPSLARSDRSLLCHSRGT
jgi:hypothetical protein